MKKKYNNYNNDNIRPRTVPKYASRAVVRGRAPLHQIFEKMKRSVFSTNAQLRFVIVVLDSVL